MRCATKQTFAKKKKKEVVDRGKTNKKTKSSIYERRDIKFIYCPMAQNEKPGEEKRKKALNTY